MASNSETAQPQTIIEKRFKILLVEDNAGDARLIQESLSDATGEPFDLEIADRLAPALRRLSGGGIDALLLDLGLPDSKGQETFDQAKAQTPAVPIIILTGLGDETLALKMVQEGAQDYVAKLNLDGSKLSRAIRYAIARDRADQEIRKFNCELEQRVNFRTAELEAANKELEAFSYSVSHDLRAPLRHIDGFSRILLESCGSKLDPSEQRYIHQICQAAERMGNLIDDLLKLARVGQQVLDLKPVCLGDLVAQVRAEFEADTHGRQIRWNVAELPRVICDEGLIKQVFSNLIGNAIKYTRRTSDVVIEVGQTLAGDTPAFFVRDNGAGFDMKYADKLFAAFQRLHTDAEFEGTGIGLATVRRIVHRHGGRIWTEAEPCKGATFYFTLESAAQAVLLRHR
ncbi:MAG: ATP-binding protein [Candidatus Acidiferrales bacterium]